VAAITDVSWSVSVKFASNLGVHWPYGTVTGWLGSLAASGVGVALLACGPVASEVVRRDSSGRQKHPPRTRLAELREAEDRGLASIPRLAVNVVTDRVHDRSPASLDCLRARPAQISYPERYSVKYLSGEDILTL